MHEFYLMCADIEAFVAEVKKRGASCGPILNRGWGLLTQLSLPGGGRLGVYQPRHARPKPVTGMRTRTTKRAPKSKVGRR